MEWILPLLPLAPALGIAIGRFLAWGGWHERQQHSCGHTHPYGSLFQGERICEKCGERGGKYTKIITRARFPLGWEVKGE